MTLQWKLTGDQSLIIIFLRFHKVQFGCSILYTPGCVDNHKIKPMITFWMEINSLLNPTNFDSTEVDVLMGLPF